MPYTKEQCRLFAVKAERGEPVPRDWRNECRKHQAKSGKVRRRAGKRYGR